MTHRLDVKRAVESLPYSRGFGKNEADVFDYVTNSMFTPAAGDRRNVANIVSRPNACCSSLAMCQIHLKFNPFTADPVKTLHFAIPV